MQSMLFTWLKKIETHGSLAGWLAHEARINKPMPMSGPVTLNCQPRTQEEIKSHMKASVENKNIHVLLRSFILSHTGNVHKYSNIYPLPYTYYTLSPTHICSDI